MTQGIVCDDLRKDFDGHRALDGISFSAPMGEVTGFVGANGAGKTTTMRILLGLARPSGGTATILGDSYRRLTEPRRQVGAVLDEPGAHPGRSGKRHLQVLAASAGIQSSRIADVLELVELTDAASRKVGGYSLGMRQRLGLAGALLGDPLVLVLDEPTKGLDPPGIRWIRGLLRSLADEGRCVLVSSHHLSELEAVADRLVMIDHGRIAAEGTTSELLRSERTRVIAKTAAPERLALLVREAGGKATRDDDAVVIDGLDAGRVGALAAEHGLPLLHLADERVQLEELFFELTKGEESNATRAGR